jgi:hypothetical protein
MLTPAIFDRKFDLRTSLGVDHAKEMGSEIEGQFKGALVEFDGEREGRLIQKFLNWPDDPQSILRFTRKYGPLEIAPVRGKAFQFPFTGFTRVQDQLRTIWRHLDKHAQRDLYEGGSLLFRGGGTVSFIAKTLYWYLYVDLITIPIERAKICKRDTCVHPYFIAGHLKQRFCSDQCAEEGQRELKRSWWDKNGQTWRAGKRGEAKAEEERWR